MLDADRVEEISEYGALLFEESPDVYAVPVDFPRPFPVRYDALTISVVAVQAMADAGLEVTSFSTAQKRREIEKAIKTKIPGWAEVEKKRKISAGILNLYSAIGFNPN